MFSNTITINITSGATRNYQRGMAIKVKKTFFRHSIFAKLKIPFLAMLALTILPFSVVVISKIKIKKKSSL